MNLKAILKIGGVFLAAPAIVLMAACTSGKAPGPEAHAQHADVAAGEAANFHDEMRSLWDDHVAWTRLAIESIAAGLPDAPATTDRLLQNQVDIGDAIKPYYGEAAGEQLTGLLKDHILIAAGLVGAAKAGDSAAVAEKKAEWYANADQIGAFLSSANPTRWQADEMKSMMRDHLDLTLNEAVHYLTGDHQASVADYDQIHRQILGMADMLSDGIVGQFADRFSAGR